MKRFKHINAKSIDKAESILKEYGGKALVVSGGTDLLGTLRKRILNEYPEIVINLKSIEPSITYIKEENGNLKIGALTTLEEIACNSTIMTKWGALAEAATKTASPRLRATGTIGGNICQLNRCWYFRNHGNRFDCIRKGGNMCFAMAGDNRYHSIFGAIKACIAVNPSDIAPALVALNATIVTNKRDIPVDDFWDVAIPGSTILDEGEIVTEIQVPEQAGKSAFFKFAIRKSIDFPIVNCAVMVSDNNARICLNAVYNKPVRATAAEDIIKGQTIDEALAESAGDAAVTDAIVMPKNGSNPGNKYKVQIAKTLVKRAILACA